MKKTVKKLYLSVAGLIASVLLLVTAVFGWFIVNKTPQVKPFVLLVTSIPTDIRSFSINDHVIDPDAFWKFEDIVPGHEFDFSITVSNNSDHYALIDLYILYNFNRTVHENGIIIDARDFFLIDPLIEYFDKYYLNDKRYIDSTGKKTVVVLDEDTVSRIIAPGESVINFKLIIANEHIYYADDDTEQNDPLTGDINLFQNETYDLSIMINVSGID